MSLKIEKDYSAVPIVETNIPTVKKNCLAKACDCLANACGKLFRKVMNSCCCFSRCHPRFTVSAMPSQTQPTAGLDPIDDNPAIVLSDDAACDERLKDVQSLDLDDASAIELTEITCAERIKLAQQQTSTTTELS